MNDNTTLILEEIKKINHRIESLDGSFNSKIESLDESFNSKIEYLDENLNSKVRSLDENLSFRMDSLVTDFNTRMDSHDSKLDSLTDEMKIIKEQTAKNAEQEASIIDLRERVSMLESDVKLIKKAVTN